MILPIAARGILLKQKLDHVIFPAMANAKVASRKPNGFILGLFIQTLFWLTYSLQDITSYTSNPAGSALLSRTCHLAVNTLCQEYFHLRAFALAVFSAWRVLPQLAT